MPEQRFTGHAQQAIAIAHREAAAEGHDRLDAHHLLLGLAQVGEGAAYALLQRYGATPEAIRRRLPNVEAGPSSTRGQGCFTGEATRCLESAHREARMEGCQFIGSEHLLFGIIDSRTTRAARVLADLGLDLMRYRQYLEEAREQGRATSDPGWTRTTGEMSPLGQEQETIADATALTAAAPAAAPVPAPAAPPAAAAPAEASSPALDAILAHNAQFVASQPAGPPLGPQPTRRLAIITCMDCRLTDFWEEALGLRRGEAVVLRNAGNALADNDDLLRSLAVAVYELGVDTVIVLGHTDCGMTKLSIGDLLERMSARGVTRDRIQSPNAQAWLGAFPDVGAHVLDTVEALRDSGLLPPEVAIHALVIDSQTGQLMAPGR